MKIQIDASLLVSILAQLSYQEGFIAGLSQALEKKLDVDNGILGDMHCDILRQFEEVKNEKP